MLAMAVLFVVGIVVRMKQTHSKQENKQWWIEFVGLFVTFVLFFVAWGFGLPALHQLNLGAVRVVFQIIFVVSIIALGVVILVFFCILSPEIREAWKSLFSRFVPGASKHHTLEDRPDAENSMYMTNRTTTGRKLSTDEDVAKDVSFTFTGNTFENPVARDYDDIKPVKKEVVVVDGAEGGAKKMTEGDDDCDVKVDLSAQVDDEELTKL